jgi:hypothetical protein
MKLKQHRLLHCLCGLILGWACAGSAFAVGNLQIDVTGATTGQTTLVLETGGGQIVKPGGDSTATQANFRNLDAGTYNLRTMANGKQVGETQRVQVRDNETSRYTVEARTGVATAVAAALLARPQQQQSMFWLGFGIGYADAKVDGSFTSPFGVGGGGMNSDGWKGGLEFMFAPPILREQRLGSFYFYGRVYSLGLDSTGYFVDAHPPVGVRDSGVMNKFDYEATLGVGWRFPVTPEFGIGVFGGGAMTRMKTTVFSNEIGGGGPYNASTSSTNSFGGNWGLEASYRLRLPQGRRTDLFFRAEQIYYGSNDAMVRSPFTGATYMGGVSSGHINQFTAGARINF